MDAVEASVAAVVPRSDVIVHAEPIIGGDEDVSRWPDYPDESRFKRFLRGYDEATVYASGRTE